jgi:aspartyl-tRNA(Asn)/glutamyl-tRNA(Gln) amidotransferase subunit C
MNITDIEKLAILARLDISAEEKESLLKDFGSIMNYIAQIGEVSVPNDLVPEYSLTNVMRADVVINEGGTYTEKLIAEMPDNEAGYLKVKQIL